MDQNDTGKQIAALVDRLIKATTAEKIAWDDTAEEDMFRVILPSGLIRIRDYGRNETGDQQFQVSVLDNNLRIVEAEVIATEAVQKLYNLARRSARDSDKLLTQLLGEIGPDE